MQSYQSQFAADLREKPYVITSGSRRIIAALSRMASAAQRLAPPVWIQNPALDFIVGCGAWSAPLLAFAYLTSASQTAAWSVTFYALALLFNYPHYMATIYRAFHDRENFRKYHFFTVYVTAAFVVLLVACHAYARLLPLVFTAYLTWSPWHYSGQNYGIAVMFARRTGAEISSLTRQCLYCSFIVSYAVLFLALHTGPSNDPLFLSLGLPETWAKPALIVLTVAFFGFAIAGLGGLVRQVGVRRLAAPIVLVSTQFLWFVLPSLLHLTSGFSIPQGRYSTGVMALMHSAQYLWITHYFQRREASRSGQPWQPFAYFGALTLGGIALFVPGPWLSAYVFHTDFRSSFLVFTSLVNLHHFILDGAIWKLRDGRIGSLLLTQHEGATSAVPKATAWSLGILRSRALRVSLAVVLLGWALLDQTRAALLAQSLSLRSLQIAERLNPRDSAVEQRIALAQTRAGHPEAALAAWIKAADLDPTNPSPRNSALSYLVERGQLEDAYRLTSRWTKVAPYDADLWANHGILAQHAGKSGDARAAWQRALQIDPEQYNARLYLADLADKEGRAADAIPLYTEYLAHVSAMRPMPPAQSVVPIVMRLSHSFAGAGQMESALKSARLACSIAASSRDPRLESIASTNEAELRLKDNDPVRAIELYQRALRLDDQAGDAHLQLMDWLSYAQLLRDRGLMRSSYASLLKARQVAGLDAVSYPEIQHELDQLARTSPQKIRGVETNLSAAVEEALAAK